MIRAPVGLALLWMLWVGVPTGAQSAQDVCSFINEELSVSEGLKNTLCQDFQAGIERGHIQPARALDLLKAVDERLSESTRASAENILGTIGFTINPAKGDLSAELLIRRVLELFSREQSKGELMNLVAQEVRTLSQTLQSVAQVYRGLGISLEPNVSKKNLQTDFGEIELTVGRVDTVITATAIALDRFERKLDRQLDDSAGMKSEVLKELRAPSFSGAVALPNELIQYIEAHTSGAEWVPIVRQLAAGRGRSS